MSKLDIKIIGAGIAGLATALSISKKTKHHVVVYEAAASLSELGARLQLMSNASRILYSLGLGNEFEEVANAPYTMELHRYADDSMIGELPQNPFTTWDYDFPNWQVYRPDFQNILAKACREAGIRIIFNSRARSVDETGRITFEDRQETADLVIAADGFRGRMRNVIEDIHARPYGEHCYRAVIPKEKMMADPVTANLMKANSRSMVWCGPGIAVLGYPVASGNLYNILTSIEAPGDKELVGKWNHAANPVVVSKLLESFAERPRKVWGLVEECNKWSLGDLPPLSSFVNGKVVVLGDAAHAILPHSGQGGAQALEDAVSLAVCLQAGLDGLNVWNKLRLDRMAGLRLFTAANHSLLMTKDGPIQEKRDVLWRGMTAIWKKEYEEIGEQGWKNKPRPDAKLLDGDQRVPETRMWLFGYDAEKAAGQALNEAGLAR